jgi:glycine/D-amino acid oxidase-like deaminating enzyme
MRSAVIVGAGGFGAALAWRLARAGTTVTLVDQFEPGDPRATSGGESRLIRCGHGPDAGYAASARRARTLWRELELETGEELLIECGLVWMAHSDDGFEARTIPVFESLGIPYEQLPPDAGVRLFPSFDPTGLSFLLHEPQAGVLRAQRATRALARAAVAHGAELIRARAEPAGAAARLADGRLLEADVVVWACGAWLGRLFPEQVAIRSTRQELYFFDGGPAWRADGVPAYVDFDRAIYGTRDIDGLGVKAAPDFDGPPLDPDAALPPAGADGEALARRFLAARFPALAQAPLSGSKTCRYELSPDANFVAAPHPEHPTTWLLGGGSGHGFKHAPALAEQVAAAFAGKRPLPSRYALGARSGGDLLRTAGALARE